MRRSRVLKPFTLAASIAALTVPAFAQSEGVSGQTGAGKATAPSASVAPEYLQLPGSGAMEGTDRTGTTGPSGSRAFSTNSGAVDAIARRAKPAGDYAATDTDRDLASRIRIAVEGDRGLAPLVGHSFHIKVDNGAVTLLGQVRNEQAKEQINAKVEALAGVQSMDNQLSIVQR